MDKPFPNSFYIFFNYYSVPRISQNFNVFGLSEGVAKLIKDKGIVLADAICIYPVRLDRGKNVEMMIKTMACLKDFSLSVKAIVVDFHSTGGDKVTYRDDLKNIGIDYGLSADELIFTSEVYPEWQTEIPHTDVLGLMRLSNVFIMPSKSESYSLITQEAGLNKCVVVLNQDFPPFRDIFGPNAIYRKYSSNIDVMNGMDGNTNTSYGLENASPEERVTLEKNYHKETAGMIASQLRNNYNLAMSIFLRKYRNLDYIFEHELSPLFDEEMK